LPRTGNQFQKASSETQQTPDELKVATVLDLRRTVAPVPTAGRSIDRKCTPDQETRNPEAAALWPAPSAVYCDSEEVITLERRRSLPSDEKPLVATPSALTDSLEGMAIKSTETA
jgi:hypothetical protein